MSSENCPHHRGRRFFFAGVAALSTGVPRREPVALLVGVGLAVVLASSLLVAVFRWIRLGGVAAYLPTHTWEVRGGGNCEPPPTVELSRAPGVAGAPVKVDLISGSRSHTATVPVGGRVVPAIEIPCAAVPRGLYRLRRVAVTITDILSLFAVVLDCTVPNGTAGTVPILRVLPQASPVADIPVPPGFAAGTPGGGSSWNRSNDLIEARPYHPGDDTRRINWKAYAHSESLFVRIGEELPPPSFSADIVVDSRGLETASELDQLISVALGVAEELDRCEYSVTLAVHVDEAGPRTLGGIDAGRRALAAVDPVYGILSEADPWRPGTPRAGRGHTLVVATGRSPAAPPGPGDAVLLWDHAQPEGGRHAWTVSFLE